MAVADMQQESGFKVLSHAALLVWHGDTKIIVDPWLVGSCYWRSWWNFPQVHYAEDDFLDVDAVFITHVHWDHWHGPSLRKFLKNKDVYVPKVSNERSATDLRSIGYDSVFEVPNGETVEIGTIKVTIYTFGLYLEDAALVIETPQAKILNANDCKLLGGPLELILKKHQNFDFALRSHSSANPRKCFECDELEYSEIDDRNHYFRAFKLFMDVVRPKYAIPFASNHCHLSDDTLHLNDYISDPMELEKWLRDQTKVWEFSVMLPGDYWSHETQFHHEPRTAFENKEDYLKAYRSNVAAMLEQYRKKEERLSIDADLACRIFNNFLERRVALGPFKGQVRILITKAGNPSAAIICDNAGARVANNQSSAAAIGEPLIIIPNIVFKDAVMKNMFHHAGISKRLRFIAVTKFDLEMVRDFFSILERSELLGTTKSLRPLMRLGFSLLRRPRDLLVFAEVFVRKITSGAELWQIEEVILSKMVDRGRQKVQ